MKPSAYQNPPKVLLLTIFCFYVCVCLTIACDGGGGSGGGSGGNGPSSRSVDIPVYDGDGTETSPIPGATCRLVDFSGAAILDVDTRLPISNVTDGLGRSILENVPLDIEGFIECTEPGFTGLILSTFVSTIGASDGETLPEEEVKPQTVVVANIVREFDASFTVPDLDAIKTERLNTINNDANANVSVLAAGAVILFNHMRDDGVGDIRFSNFTNTSIYGALEDLSDNNVLNGDSWTGVNLETKNKTENDITIRNLDLSAASNSGDLKGRAFNRFGVVLSGARVTALATVTGQFSETFTDRSGRFAFTNLPAEQTLVFILGIEVANIPVIGAAVVDLGNIRVDTTGQAVGNIRGQVRDQDNSLRDGVDIIALQNDTLVGGPVTSGPDGEFFISNVPVGVTVVRRDPNFNTTPATVMVLEGQTVNTTVLIQIIF